MFATQVLSVDLPTLGGKQELLSKWFNWNSHWVTSCPSNSTRTLPPDIWALCATFWFRPKVLRVQTSHRENVQAVSSFVCTTASCCLCRRYRHCWFLVPFRLLLSTTSLTLCVCMCVLCVCVCACVHVHVCAMCFWIKTTWTWSDNSVLSATDSTYKHISCFLCLSNSTKHWFETFPKNHSTHQDM